MCFCGGGGVEACGYPTSVRRGGSNFSVVVTKGNERWRAEKEGKDGLRDGGKEEAAGTDAAVAGINSLLRSLTLLSLRFHSN